LAFAHNKEGTRGASTKGSGEYVHAEKNLLLSIKGNYSLLRDASIYVARISPIPNTREKEFTYSQPCPECTVLLTKCMKTYGLKKVFFTTKDGHSAQN
jgi:deoxycytidylate deaminase